MEVWRMPDNLKISLAAARINAGLTQEETARRLHVAKSTIVAWEMGRRSPSIAQAIELCTLYGRSVDSISF